MEEEEEVVVIKMDLQLVQGQPHMVRQLQTEEMELLILVLVDFNF